MAYFWEAPSQMQRLPWAVTANVAFKNTGRVHFKPEFLKTGGGEDVDACLQVGVRVTNPLHYLGSSILCMPPKLCA